MTEENGPYSSNYRKPISRARLEKIKEQLVAPVRTMPPMIGTYPRAIDVELFQLFWSNPVLQVSRSAATLAGEVTTRPRQEWAYQVKSTLTEDYDDQGRARSVEVKADPPRHYEVPRYTSVVEDAIELRDKLLSSIKHIRIEEVPQEDELPLWRAEMLDENGQVEGSGETYDTAASIVLAIVSDLLTNDAASWWVKAVDKAD